MTKELITAHEKAVRIATLHEARIVTCPFCAIEMPMATEEDPSAEPGVHLYKWVGFSQTHPCKAMKIRELIEMEKAEGAS